MARHDRPGAAPAIAAAVALRATVADNCAPMSRLKLDFCGLKLNSPVVLLSGCVGFGEEYTRIEGFSNAAVGAIVLKGTTLAPRLGNPPHRVWETPAGMLNAIGLQNPGVDYVVKTILPSLDFKETRFIANVCGSTIEEYAEVTRRFDDSPIDAMEINISCPNVKEGGVAFGNYPEMSARVVAACRAVTSKPLITKLSPNQTDSRANARACIDAGTDAFAVINPLMGGHTPILTMEELGQLGFNCAVLGLDTVMHAAKAIENVLLDMKSGRFAMRNDGMDFEDYKKVVGYDKWESVDERFAPKQ
jgi:dihydroorotate dehydrogenase subfamily 1